MSQPQRAGTLFLSGRARWDDHGRPGENRNDSDERVRHHDRPHRRREDTRAITLASPLQWALCVTA